MAIFDPGDCAYSPNVLHTDSKQYLGNAIINVNALAGTVGETLGTVLKFGTNASGIYNKYHKRNHTDYFNVLVFAS